MYTDDAVLVLISSITSTKIEKITLNYPSTFGLFVGQAYWTRLDNILVKLGEQSECELGLLVEIQAALVTRDEELTEYLPRFVEKGRAIVLDMREGSIHSSDKDGEGKQPIYIPPVSGHM